MKKQANKEVFQSILENFKISLADLDFIDENIEFFLGGERFGLATFNRKTPYKIKQHQKAVASNSRSCEGGVGSKRREGTSFEP